MNSKIFINAHIKNIIDSFTFSKRKKFFPNACPCYKQDKPCHAMAEDKFNCFLCYCPNYNSDSPEGGCKVNCPKGKWFFDEALPQGKIWDCSECSFPHRREEVGKKLREVFELEE